MWIALADAGDQHHRAAAEAYPGILRTYQRLITTTLTVAEAYVSLRRDLGHQSATLFIDHIDSSAIIDRVPVDRSLELRAEAILRQYADQLFSYVDAVSFATMEARGITHAFAFDRHFSTAGFVRVPA